VQGGFKSWRTFLLRYLEESCHTQKFVILSGMTGTGKTDIINTLDTSLDLEGYANHKGSSFGRPLNEQPSQIDFENRLISALLKVRTKYPNKSIVIEDENRSIGGVHLPHILVNAMAASIIVVIELPHEERIQKLWQEYVLDRFSNTMAFYKAKRGNDYEKQAQQAFSSYLTESLFRIQKRLGQQRTQEILVLMDAAISRQHIDNFASHQDWLRVITQDYYDPMYRYQLNKRKESVVFTGDHKSVVQYLRELA
jgi:tRNA 2-selenouridine synthase